MPAKDHGLTNKWKSDSNITAAFAFLMLLLAADLGFFIIHFLSLVDGMNNPRFSLELDGGYPEIYQYAKTFWVAVLLVLLFVRTRLLGYAVWSLLFMYLLIDDALGIHESFGAYISQNLAFSPAMGLRAQDFGEITVSAIAAVVFLAPLALFYVRGVDSFKSASQHLVVLLVALAFFGVFVDMLHVAVDLGWKVAFVLGAIEDGGEMVVMSVIASYAFLLVKRDGRIGDLARSTSF